MLSMTSNAAQLVGTMRNQQGVPDDYGIRVFPQPSDQGVQVRLAFAAQPAEDDQIAETEGQRLFVAPELAEPLTDTVIDAAETSQGPGLVLRERDQGAGTSV